MVKCEYFTDALGTKFPKRVESNEIRILVDKSSRSVDFCYPSSFTSEERQSRVYDLKVISAEIEKGSIFITNQFLGKPLNTSLIEEIGSSLEELLNNKISPKLTNRDYKVTYWLQE